MNFQELMESRYTTKHYDNTRKVSDETLRAILQAVRLSPTSVNSQPYHFYVLTGESKNKLREGIKDFNQSRYDSASHAIVITCKTKIDEEHLQAVLQAEIKDGRLPNDELIAAQYKSRHFFSNLHVEKGDYTAWTCKQAYIAFATLLYAAHDLGVDSTALEGIDYDKVNEIMDLESKGECCALVVSLGYRAHDDSNTLDKRPKSRLSLEQLVSFMD